MKYGSSQEPSARWVSTSQPHARARPPAVALAGRQQGHQRPGGLRGGRGAPADPRRVRVGAQVLAPAAVVVLVLLQPAAPPAGSAGLAGGQPAAISAGTTDAGAVDVVDAPAAEPGAVRLLLGEQPGRCRAGCAGRRPCPRAASISTTCAVTSADGGSMTSPKSQNGSRLGKVLVLSASNAPQPPSRDCMPRFQRDRPVDGRAHRVRVGVRRRGAARAPPRRCRRCRGSCRCANSNAQPPGGEFGPAHRPVARTADLLAEHPVGGPHAAPGRRRARRRRQRDERQAGVPHRRLAGLDHVPGRPRSSPGR